ncbi:glucose dehydrogenase [FAD, quinone]-like, partial [Asbolus verrucosus]
RNNKMPKAGSMSIILLLLMITASVLSSPFKLTEEYVEEFKSGIAALKKIAHEHTFKEENFDHSLYNTSEALDDPTEYDFIIIGAGASGSVLANRLSERPEWKVLVLEAGAPETPFTQIPHLGRLLQNTDYNWAYVTTPQKNWCKGMINNQCAIAGGKALGGGTAINGMLYTRGNAKDYDLWADQGNDGWCYNDVLPYFKKAEDADLEDFDHKYHNRGGPFHLEHPQYLTHITDDTLAAGKELGLDTVDYNGKEQLGLGVVQINSKRGKRQSTAQAYLEPARTRHNLSIKPLSHVIKIIISPHTKEATGVEYLHDGKLYSAKAHKEVILSAGAINTPQILMLSGIGPKEQLEKLEIPLVQDLRVGHNFKDHIAFFGLDLVYNETQTEEHDESDEILEYLKNGKGPLTSTGCEVIGYLQTEISKDSAKYPDIEIFFSSKKLSAKPGLNPFRLKDEVYESLWKPVDDKKAINIGVMLAHPKSTGSVVLKDKDPLHHPLIDPNQLSDPDEEDLNTLVAGIRKAVSFSKTETMKKLGLAINDNIIAGCEGHEWGSDEYWKCASKHLTISLRHVTGTAKMGPQNDKDAVVDNKLRVHGVHKLRVADASVIPVTITGHTMAPAIMIGEKAADLIKNDWK